MRYFRRSGPDVLVWDPPDLVRMIAGPKPAYTAEDGTEVEGVESGRIAYDESDPRQAQWADQLTGAQGWYEVDANGDALVPAEPEAEPPAPSPVANPVTSGTLIPPPSPAPEPETSEATLEPSS